MALQAFWSGSCVAKTLRVMGVALIAIGAAGYLLPAGPVHWTALIPAILGAAALGASLVGNAFVAAGLGAVIAAVALMGGGSALMHVPALVSGEAGAAIASRAATAAMAILGLGTLAYALAFGRRTA
jgi:hypothetical protein